MIKKAPTALFAVAALAVSTSTCSGETHPTASCVRARIHGRIECLSVGMPCQPRYEHDYQVWGFACKRDAHGRYRLRYYIYSGQPRP
jgi:hypothetical protein